MLLTNSGVLPLADPGAGINTPGTAGYDPALPVDTILAASTDTVTP